MYSLFFFPSAMYYVEKKKIVKNITCSNLEIDKDPVL